MNRLPAGTVPVVLMIKGTVRDVFMVDNPIIERVYSEQRPLVINLTDSHDLWWLSGGASADVDNDEFIELVRDYILQLLTRELQKRWRGQRFSREWRRAVKVVYINPYAASKSPTVRRVFEGFFPNAELLYSDPEELVSTHPDQEVLTWHIEKLQLSNRLEMLLLRHGLDKVQKIFDIGERGLLDVAGIGQLSITEIERALDREGLELPRG